MLYLVLLSWASFGAMLDSVIMSIGYVIMSQVILESTFIMNIGYVSTETRTKVT